MPRKKVEEQAVEAVVEEPKVEVKEEKIPDGRALVLSQLSEQYSLSWQDQQSLIRSESPLMETGVRLAVKVAMSFSLPLQGINVINDKKGNTNIYVNSDGVRWRVHTDPRIVKSSTATIVHRPSKDEPWVESEATVEFNDGSRFTNWGVVSCQPGPDYANAAMKSITKAKRRAGVDAVGVALPIFEDAVEWQEEQRSQGKFVDGSYTEMPSTPKKITDPKNLAEFFTWVTQSGHTMDEVTQIIGDASTVAQDVPGAVKKLKEAWNEEQA